MPLKLFKTVLHLLMPFGPFVVSDSLFDLLADVSHLRLLLSVHIFLVSMRAKSSRSLLLIVSSPCAAVVAVCCWSVSPANSSLCLFVVVMCCCCSASPIISPLGAAVVVVVFCRSGLSASSFAAASCLPMNLFSSSSYFRSISLNFRMARDLRVFPLMQIVTCIVYFCKDVVSDLCCPILLSSLRMQTENAQ